MRDFLQRIWLYPRPCPESTSHAQSSCTTNPSTSGILEHIGTFRGNHLAFAAGAAAVDVIRRDDILDNVRKRGEQLAARLRINVDRSAWALEARGLGL